jgi:hypothetical protein
MKVKILKHTSIYFGLPYLKPYIEISQIFLNLGPILSIEKPQKAHDFSTFKK